MGGRVRVHIQRAMGTSTEKKSCNIGWTTGIDTDVASPRKTCIPNEAVTTAKVVLTELVETGQR